MENQDPNRQNQRLNKNKNGKGLMMKTAIVGVVLDTIVYIDL